MPSQGYLKFQDEGKISVSRNERKGRQGPKKYFFLCVLDDLAR
jgi:hypothetical protein